MAKWRIYEARRRLDTVIDRALAEGPQIITCHGIDRAIVLSIDKYRKLAGDKQNFKSFLMSIPVMEGVEFEGSKDAGREIDL